MNNIPNKNIVTPIMDYIEQSYFEYATYVIHDRALPFIGDGLKPVARRIIYAMSELSLHAQAKHKKSARTVGDVLGKFHPHGDQACYEAMVLMAQSFSYRYPFIDGQGNWGSIDEPKSFAAMRYTESRLSHYASVMLDELGSEIVEWSENFDGSLKEPKYLPSRLPNVLLNGAMGIAVGIATDIAPHNIFECVNALLAIIKDEKCSDDDILQHILGPDLPTGGILISSREEILQAYKTGQGNYRVRATFEIFEKNLLITSLPYQVSSSRIMKQIAELVLGKKLLGVEDIRDDSDEEHPVRIALLLKGQIDYITIMNIVFAYTDCEKSYRIQQYVLNMEHKPVLFTLPGLLREWLNFRKKIVTNRLTAHIKELDTRLHILDGLKIITLNMDEVITIIRYEDHPENVLVARFALSERQIKAIMEIRLRQLTKVEWISLEQEQQKKSKIRDALVLSLGNVKHFNLLLKNELIADAKRFGNIRRTAIEPQDSAVRLSKAVQVVKEDVKVFLSKELWIRSSRNLNSQADTLIYHSSDEAYLDVTGSTEQTLLLWNSEGQAYSIPAIDIPSIRSKGDPLSKWVNVQSSITHMIIGDESPVLVITSDGYGFITDIKNAKSRLKNGKGVVTIPQPFVLQIVMTLHEESHVALLSTQGRILILEINNIPRLKKGRGVKLLSLLKEDLINAKDSLCQAIPLNTQQVLYLEKNTQSWTQSPAQWQAHIAKRGHRGSLVPRCFRSQAKLLTLPTVDLKLEK